MGGGGGGSGEQVFLWWGCCELDMVDLMVDLMGVWSAHWGCGLHTGDHELIIFSYPPAHTAPSPPPHPPQVKYSPPPPPPPPSPPPASGVDKAVAIKGFKSVMVRTMTASGQVPQFGYSDEVDVSKMVALHGVLKAELAKRGVKFSYMPVFVKALSLALLQYPILNSHVDEMCTVITYKSSHNIGIAMDTPEGLVVPNIKGVEVSQKYPCFLRVPSIVIRLPSS